MMYHSPESAEAIASLTRPYGRREALDPATRPLPPYDCPTGTCRTDKVCEEVVDGETLMHKRMDVHPHGANPNYAPNLTETY